MKYAQVRILHKMIQDNENYENIVAFMNEHDANDNLRKTVAKAVDNQATKNILKAGILPNDFQLTISGISAQDVINAVYPSLKTYDYALPLGYITMIKDKCKTMREKCLIDLCVFAYPEGYVFGILAPYNADTAALLKKLDIPYLLTDKEAKK